jgi:pyruvate formate lyase activating enzyme
MRKALPSLADALAEQTREGTLYERYDGDWTRCLACGHRCPIPNGAQGVCKVRFNRDGHLMVPWGYVACAQCDPIEKKPFYHAFPGTRAFSFGMLGCDFHCVYCQNWVTSQALRDPEAILNAEMVTPEELVRAAVRAGARSVVSTYNEPLITAEWAGEIFTHARAAGLATGVVSNGHGTPEVLAFLGPLVDLFKVDLKSFDDAKYRRLGGRLQPVLDTIAELHRTGRWIEVVTLLVPGFNDSDGELRRLTGFLREVSPAIPWHVTAYHEDYRMSGNGPTTAAMLQRAAGIGSDAGLAFVYAGNIPGSVGSLEDTRCPSCHETLIERRGYLIRRYRLTPDGACPSCAAEIPGRWNTGTSDSRQ